MQVTSTTAESWLGRPLVANPSIDDIVLRYFAAFGPATVADVSAWCRLTGMREVVERLRPRLRAFRDERGRELFDLPDAPRPDPEVPAPPRFVPEYDNVLLSHADRTRFVSADDRARLSDVFGLGRGAVLSDGLVCGAWRLDGETLVVSHLDRLTKRAADALAAEARRLLRFLGAGGEIHLEVVRS